MKPIAIIIAAAALLIGLIVGFFVGRVMLERQWSQPMGAIDPKAERKASTGDADPTPAAGTKVLGKMPITRGRMVLKDFTAKDKAVADVAAVGSGDEGLELHVVVENKGACELSDVSGVAYGFDAYGRSAAMNKSGEHYVAFSAKTEIKPGEKKMVAQKLKFAQASTLALAQIDATACKDGSKWKRN